MPLTATTVRHAKPGRHADGKGLYLLVKPSPNDPAKGGARSWVLRVMHKGKRRDYGLGSVIVDERNRPDVGKSLPLHRRKSLTLSEAREKARIGRELAKAGIDPSKEWKAEELEVPTFEEAATEYHGHVAKAWRNGKHRDQWLNTLKAYAFPKIGARLVDDIDAAAIQSVLLPIWLEKPETARRVGQRINVVLDYSHGKGWRDTEAPARAVNNLLRGIKQPKGGHHAALPWKDLPEFMARVRDGDSIGRRALQFAILTAARSNEVRGATWAEIDLEAAEWRLPASRMKTGLPHIVPLVPAALDILKAMAGLFPSKPGDTVFPGLKGKPMSENTLTKVIRTNGGGSATLHGFRSTFRDWAADNGHPKDWAEAALAHTVEGQEGKTAAAYRRTTYLDQRAERLMPEWARYALGDDSSVIALAERRA